MCIPRGNRERFPRDTDRPRLNFNNCISFVYDFVENEFAPRENKLFYLLVAPGESVHLTGLCCINSPDASIIMDCESLPRANEFSDNFVMLGFGGFPVGNNSFVLPSRPTSVYDKPWNPTTNVSPHLRNRISKILSYCRLSSVV